MAVLAGYLSMVIVVMVGLTIMLAMFSDAFPTEPGPYEGPAYILILEWVLSLFAAMGGGAVCAWVAGHAERRHALWLAGVLVVFSVVSTLGEMGLKPLWSSIGLAVIGPLGVLWGAALAQRRRERHALAKRPR